MKKTISIVIAVAVLAALAYFWKNRDAQVSDNLSLETPAPEDASIAQELQVIESLDLDSEFKDIDADLKNL